LSAFDVLQSSSVAIPALAALILAAWILVWIYNDAERRGKPGCLVVLLVLLVTPPLGLLVWLVFRPDYRLPDN